MGEEKKQKKMVIVKIQSNGMELKIFGASLLLFLLIYSSVWVVNVSVMILC